MSIKPKLAERYPTTDTSALFMTPELASRHIQVPLGISCVGEFHGVDGVQNGTAPTSGLRNNLHELSSALIAVPHQQDQRECAMTKSAVTLEELMSRLDEQSLTLTALRASIDVQFKRIASRQAELDLLPQAARKRRETLRHLLPQRPGRNGQNQNH